MTMRRRIVLNLSQYDDDDLTALATYIRQYRGHASHALAYAVAAAIDNTVNQNAERIRHVMDVFRESDIPLTRDAAAVIADALLPEDWTPR